MLIFFFVKCCILLNPMGAIKVHNYFVRWKIKKRRGSRFQISDFKLSGGEVSHRCTDLILEF